MYQKIMVPLDGSELAECVLPNVEAIAKGCPGSTVVFVRVVEPAALTLPRDAEDYYTGKDYALLEEWREQTEAGNRSAAKAYLKNLVSRFESEGVKVESDVIAGKAADSLADYAVKNDVDLIVIATHGHSGLKRWAWGSVAERLLRSSCVPVLMVRAPGCVAGI
jgi:nucleotide-binding universal stress UspA family protein